MNTTSDKPLSGGYLFELVRDNAKEFFGLRGDEPVRDYVVNLSQAENVNKLKLDSHWETLARLFSNGTLDPSAGEPPLQWCFLGGRPMFQGDQSSVMLVRPDMVRHVAEALADADTCWLKSRVEKLTATADGPIEITDDVASMLPQLRDFYNQSAEAGSAVVFAVDH
ncbi:MAG: DUF1877 family protein [Planctomycetota bacterium]